MRVLVVEDSPERHAGFRLIFKDDTLVLADQYDDAIKALESTEPFDQIWLDHDLNDFGMKSTAPGVYGDIKLTGQDLAMWITRNLKYRPKFIVHSWNPPGALAIQQTLRDAGFDVTSSPYRAPAKLSSCPVCKKERFYHLRKGWLCAWCNPDLDPTETGV